EIQIGLGDRDQARATLQRALDLQSRLSGADSPATALARARLGEATFAAGDAAGATTLLRDALPRLRAGYGADSREAAAAEASLATFEHVAGNRDEAFRLATHALAVARSFGDAPEIAMRLAEIGRLQQESSQYDAALRSFDESLRIIERDQGERHARTVILHAQIGDVLRYQRRYEESQRHYETALAIEREQLPAGHALIGSTLLRLGDLQRRRGRLEDAERAFAEALSILPEGNAQRAQALQYSAELAEAQGRFDLAVERHRAAFATFRRATGDSLYTWLAATQLMQAMIQAGRLADADALAAEAVPAIARVSEADAYERAVADAAVGQLRHAQQRFTEAIALRRHALAVMTHEYGEQHVETARARIELAASLAAARDASLRDEAATLLERAARALEDSSDPQAADALGLLDLERARLHLATGARADARADLAQAMARLQSPRRLPQLREAQALARTLR
ncbi:MAG TPA: tetratricopeptide repeat protein, partial [Dokdonella sp.]|nr:tetratricopeptide repeat protein [Dokdonella sp.]